MASSRLRHACFDESVCSDEISTIGADVHLADSLEYLRVIVLCTACTSKDSEVVLQYASIDIFTTAILHIQFMTIEKPKRH